MSDSNPLPDGLISYGGDANCTLALCPLSSSVYGYLPTLPGNSVLIALFGIALILHIIRSVRWKEWAFMSCMILGCVCEMVGYGGRVWLHNNPFSFNGFLMQIICITIGPVFLCAAIYVLLGRIIQHIGPQYSRFPPMFYFYVFITCDIVSLVLQSIGGAMSSTSSGSSNMANDIAIAGLSFQVATLVVFIGLCADFAIRYRKGAATNMPLTGKFKLFIAFLSFALLLILIRCAYRIDELSGGYSGPLIANEGLFIGLESVMIIVAVYALLVAHPGPPLHEGGVTPSMTGATKVTTDEEKGVARADSNV